MNPRQLVERHPWVVDGAIFAALLGIGLAELLRSYGKLPPDFDRPYDAVQLAVWLAGLGTLFWRRRAPLPALGVYLALTLALRLAGYGFTQVDAAVPMFFLYAAGAFPYGPRRWRVAAAVAGAAGTAFLVNYPLDINAVNLVGLTGVGCAVYLLGEVVERNRRDARIQRGHVEALEAQREERIRRAVADERSHIARELHDVVAHSLGFIALEAQAGEAVFDRDPARAREALATVGTAGRQGLAEMRRLLAVLREDSAGADRPEAPQPTLGELPALVEQVRGAGMAVDLRLDVGRHADLPAGIQLAAYRIVQEALTNALKHAGPARVYVRLSQENNHVWDRLSIEVVDTGDPAARPYPRPRDDDHVPHGLIGMRERVVLYGGAFEAGPLSGTGWRVSAVLPLREPVTRPVAG